MRLKWCARLLGLGGLAVALGCRAHPHAPPCATPLLPGEVVPGPANVMPGPPLAKSLPTPTQPSIAANAPPPAAANPPPSIQPPGAFARLPESTYPGTKPSLKPAEPVVPLPVTDLPPILPPKDVAPILTSTPKPAETILVPESLPAPSPAVKPPLIEVPRSKTADDGFGPGPRLPATPEPVLGPGPTRATNPETGPAPLPLKPGETYGHGSDYKWLAGVADRHLKGAYWTIRFADIGTDDAWGGKVRLLDDERLRDLRNGDVIYVEGELLAPTSAAESTAYPPFRVTSLRVIDKAR